jgi:DNA-binding response OmpR family regulator
MEAGVLLLRREAHMETLLRAGCREERAIETIHVLAILPKMAGCELERIVGHTRWEMRVVHTVEEGLQELGMAPASVVICDAGLPDGSWRDILQHTDLQTPRPAVIVASNGPDDCLWAEALNCGAYDILAWPFEAQEVYNVITAAWRRWKEAQWSSKQASLSSPAK